MLAANHRKAGQADLVRESKSSLTSGLLALLRRLLLQRVYVGRFARVLEAGHSLIHVFRRRVDPNGYQQPDFWKFKIRPVRILTAFFAEPVWSAPSRLTAIRALSRLSHIGRTPLMVRLSRPPLWLQTEPAFSLGVRTLGQVHTLRKSA
jgi:hypothetical protein